MRRTRARAAPSGESSAAAAGEALPPADRRTVARTIDALRARAPAAILLDLDFLATCSPATRGCTPDPGTVALANSLTAAPFVPIYAAANPHDSEGGADLDVRFLAKLDRRIYDHVGSGNTIFEQAPAADSVVYRRCYPELGLPLVDSAGRAVPQDSWSLVYLVATDARSESRPSCASQGGEMEAVRMGDHADFARSVAPITSAVPFPANVDVGKKLVIVSAMKSDQGPLSKRGRTNPEVVAWALSDLLGGAQVDFWQPRPAGEMLIALVAAFALTTLVAFIAAFQGLRRLALRGLRPHLPWIAASASVVFALALFGAFEAALFFFKQIQPQVSLVAMSVALAGVVCARRGYQILDDQDRGIYRPPEDAHDYDVFISYASENLAWVRANVHLPLSRAVLSDGSRLKIFFDQDPDEIRYGEAWRQKLSLAISGSRHVVAVFSADYFKPEKVWCKLELGDALDYAVRAGPEARFLLPVNLDGVTFPREFELELKRIQAPSFERRPGLMDEVIREIVAGAEARRSG